MGVLLRTGFVCALAVCLVSAIDVWNTPKNHPNILFITIDTLRRDHLGFYGSTVNTPNLDALAAKGVVFDNYYSSANCTMPAHLSLFSGKYPNTFSIFDNEKYDIENRLVLFPSFLKKVGYATYGVASVPFLGKDWLKGFGQQFDWFSAPSQDSRKAEEVTEQFDEILPLLKMQKFFVWLHFYDPHSPYEPPERFRKMYHADKETGPLLPKFSADYVPANWLKDRGIRYASVPAALYKGEVSYTDEQIGEVLDLLKRSGLEKNTVVVIVADHGEMLGHRGIYYNHQTLFDGTIHVPFLVYGKMFSPRRAESLASTVDIAPTLMDIAGSPIPIYFEGLSLVPVLNGSELPPTRIALSFHAEDIADALIRLPYKYIHSKAAYGDPENYELYDVFSDPNEYHNQAESNPFVFRIMDELADARIDKSKQQPLAATPLTRKEREKLEALGYTQ